MVVEPPENPTFSTKKEKYGGGISKNESKVGFSGGASAGVSAQAAGLSLRASLETGSRQIVKLHQNNLPTLFWSACCLVAVVLRTVSLLFASKASIVNLFQR